jgi:hypothetical protein
LIISPAAIERAITQSTSCPFTDRAFDPEARTFRAVSRAVGGQGKSAKPQLATSEQVAEPADGQFERLLN